MGPEDSMNSSPRALRIGCAFQSLSSGTLRYSKDFTKGVASQGGYVVTIGVDSVIYPFEGVAMAYRITYPFISITRNPLGRVIVVALRFPFALQGILKVAIRERLEVLYTNNLDEGAFLTCLAGRLLGIPSVVLAHDLTDRELYVYEAGFPRGLLPLLFALARMRQRVVAVFSPFIFVASKFMQRSLQGATRRPILVIPHGIQPARGCHKTHPPHGGTYLLSVGTIQLKKGLSTAIRALGRLGDLDLKLIVIGEGPQRRRLESLASVSGVSERVRFMGYVSDEVLEGSIMDAFAGVVPSFWEGFGYAALEMMAGGLPVIASNVGALSEIVIPEENGLLFRVGDDAELAEKIRRLYTDKSLLDRCRRGAFETAGRYTFERMSHMTYENLLKIRDDRVA